MEWLVNSAVAHLYAQGVLIVFFITQVLMDPRVVCSVTNNSLITKGSINYKFLALWFYVCMRSLKSPNTGVLMWGSCSIVLYAYIVPSP